MSVWDRVIKKALGPMLDQEIKKAVIKLDEEKVEKGVKTHQMTNYLALNSPLNGGSGVVVNRPQVGRVGTQTLRDLSIHYPILRACINYRKRQISSLAWDIASREVVMDEKEKESQKKDADMVKQLLAYPVGDKTMSFRTFVSKIMEDTLILDAMVLAKRKNRKGGLYGYLPIDAATIKLVLNEDGTVPLPPDPAYIQEIAGTETGKFTTDEMIYRIMNARTTTPYGLSPVESLVLTVSTALKLGAYNLAYLSEGNVPEGFVQLPKDVASNPDQLSQWQNAWDAMFSGNPQFQRKIKFLPEGMKWDPIRKQEDMEFERFEKWLLQVTCAMMEVPPQAIGFQFERGKGATESEWEIGKERGLFPMANFLKEVMDQIVQDDLKQDKLEFIWTNINPTNKKEEADVFKALVGTGAVSVDEWRISEGMSPIGMPQYIMTPTGPVSVEQFKAGIGIASQAQGGSAQPPAPDKFSPEYKPQNPPKTETPTTAKPDEANVQQKIKRMARAEIIDEIQKWRKAAINDLKQGRGFREFKTDILDIRTQNLIKSGLKAVSQREELDELFSPFINQENQVITAMLDLYDEVKSISGGDLDGTEKSKKD